MSDVSSSIHTAIPESSISSDLLIGAAAISVFLYGTPDKRRKVYHLAKTSRMPHFHMGSQICARRSELSAWLRAKL